MELTKEMLREAFDKAWKEAQKPRKTVLWRYCKGVGGTIRDSGDSLFICNDPECFFCSIFREEFKSYGRK